MLRSLYSGISGMKVNQVKMDVIGNNVANVGTTAFKSSRVRFQDMLSQNMSSASSPSRNQGGVNASQVGLGVQVSGIDTIVRQGMMQPTGRNLDVAVDGEGYFMVGRGALPISNADGVGVSASEHTITGGNMEISFSRDGALALDYDGNLLNSDGYRILGYAVKEKTGYNIDSNSIDWGKNGINDFVDADSKDGLVSGSRLVPLRIPGSVHVNAVNINNATPVQMNYTGTGITEKIDGTNNLVHAKIDTNTNKYVGNTDLQVEVKWAEDPDSAATPKEKNWRILANGKDITEASSSPTELFVDKNGNVTKDSPDGTEGIDFTQINISEPDSNIPEGQEDKYSWGFTVNAERDKKVRSFAIEKDGLLKAVLEDGKVSVLGQLAMASFKNPEGLEKMGKNLYVNSPNSGQPMIRSGVGADPANDNSDGYGDALQGMLEMSNVDLAEQFTDMIVTSRAFQASSKMISTGDEILQDIINLKR